jgi:hypothetical protein
MNYLNPNPMPFQIFSHNAAMAVFRLVLAAQQARLV